LVACPNCGTKVVTAIKCWTVAPAKKSATGYIPEFRVGIFKCPACKAKFKSKVNAISKPAKTSVKDLIVKVKEIQQGFTRTLWFLREKIMILETEQAGLLGEIEELKRAAESRANALKSEVNRLREELRSLRELLGANE
jgi:uncharacterized Zn finger protein (UPF0148 family)